MKKIKFLILLIILLTPAIFANNFLVITDIHLNAKTNGTMTIAPTGFNPLNDLDRVTYFSLLSKITTGINNGTIQKPKFILLLGDLAAHMRLGKNPIFNDEAMVYSSLKQYFPTTPIFSVFGNNDSLQGDYGPFNDNKYSTPYKIAMLKGWLDGFLSTGIKCTDNDQYPCIAIENTNNGYYTAYLEPKLKLIALNSVLFTPDRESIFTRKQNVILAAAAKSELTWFDNQLTKAEQNHDTVLIAMHVPFGNNLLLHKKFWIEENQKEFLKIITAHKNSIIGILVGHTHYEELKVLQNNKHEVITAEFYTAGLSTAHGNVPSVKTFYYSKENNKWQLTNYDAFGGLQLNKLYDFKSYYCADQNTNNMLDCLKNFNPIKIKKYYTAGNPNFAGLISSPGDAILVSAQK